MSISQKLLSGISKEMESHAINFQAFNVPAGPIAKIEVVNISTGKREIRTFDNVAEAMVVWAKSKTIHDLLNMVPKTKRSQ